MLISIPFPKGIRFTISKPFDLFPIGIFLYFLTLHADQLNIVAGGATVRINNLIALLLGFILLMQPEIKVIKLDRKLVWGIIGLAASFFISFYYSPYRTRCFFFLGWFGFTALFYLFLPYLFFHLFDPKKILKLYLASFFCVGVIAFLQWLISFCGVAAPFAVQMIRGTIVRPNAFAYEPSFYALYMTPFVVMATLHYYLQKNADFFLFKTLTLKKLLIIHFFFLISTATSTVFAYFIFFSVLSLVCMATSWKKIVPSYGKIVLKSVVILTCLFLVVWVIFPKIMEQFYLKFFVQDFRLHHSFFERWAGIVNAWKIFVEHPLIGVGIGGIPPHLFDAWSRGETGYLFLFTGQVPDYERVMKLFEPSNICTELLASLGIVGAAAFLFFIFCYIQKVNEVKKLQSIDPLLIRWVFILFISVLVMLIVLQFNQGLFRTYIWTHFAIAYAFTERAIHTRISLKGAS